MFVATLLFQSERVASPLPLRSRLLSEDRAVREYVRDAIFSDQLPALKKLQLCYVSKRCIINKGCPELIADGHCKDHLVDGRTHGKDDNNGFGAGGVRQDLRRMWYSPPSRCSFDFPHHTCAGRLQFLILEEEIHSVDGKLALLSITSRYADFASIKPEIVSSNRPIYYLRR